MKRLDKVGLDYLILMAKDIGFRTVSMDTKESENCSPCVTITFEQTRELTTPTAFAPTAMSPPVTIAGSMSSNILPGQIAPGQVSIAGTQPNRNIFSTLDDDPEDQTPPCSTSKS